jgi:dTDP-4-dehydrorhamnose 3,5-epimerase
VGKMNNFEVVGCELDSVYTLVPKVFSDNRGSFNRIYCKDDLEPILGGRTIKQINISRNTASGTIRGMHYQTGAFAETKIIQCIKGRVFDVAVDIRRGSQTFLKWFGVELSSCNSLIIVIPEGFAHGFQVLEDDSELLYFHTAPYNKEHECGLSFCDKSVNIKWPLPAKNVSQRDETFEKIDQGWMGIEI